MPEARFIDLLSVLVPILSNRLQGPNRILESNLLKVLVKVTQAYDVDLSGLGENDFAAPKLIDPIKLRQLLVAVQNMEKLVLILENQPQGKIEIATVEDAIFRILVDCLDSSQRNNSLPYSNRLVVRRRVLDYIQSHVREVITINELCRACATTSRTLERVFREEFSVTPKRYLTLLKLSGIRHELCQLNQEKSIRDIAISWGFWHMSQFAQDYKNHYGELPSQTRQSNLGSTKKA